jgi:amidase
VRWIVLALVMAAGIATASAKTYDVAEKDVATLQADMEAGRVTSAALVRAYLKRIRALDRAGPGLRSVIALNPHALADAQALDAERKAKGARGALHGIPILVKDNVETADPMPTTAGSLALTDNLSGRDAPAIARLRAAGAVILGKANLSEWANIRSARSISGWSGIGGLVKNPYVLDRSACGSSSGSAAAVAASLAAAAIGSETDGSLVCPGSLNGVVAFKPTLGLVSRTHVIPISHSQDTTGPMARSVADAAALLAAMAGSDPDDVATAEADTRKSDYAAALAGASLQGKRLGVVPPAPGTPQSETDLVFAATLASLTAAGADIVEIADFTPPPSEASDNELTVLKFELKADMNAYLATTHSKMRTLSDLIAFNKATPREMALFGQDLFEAADATTDLSDPAYLKARDALKTSSRGLLDRLFAQYKLDALIRATDEPSFRIDTIKGDNDSSSASFLPATSGYPHLTVPMGFVRGLPVGLSFMGPAWSDASILALGHAFEQATHARRPPAFVKSLEAAPDTMRAFAPAASR